MSAACSLADCPTCGGEGFVFVGEGHAEESPICCAECDGTGTLEVCARCGEALEIEAGREVCPCMKVQVVT